MGFWDNLSTPEGQAALLGMTQAFAQAAQPTRIPLGFGAALGMGGAGALQGKLQGYPDYQLKQAEIIGRQQQNQMGGMDLQQRQNLNSAASNMSAPMGFDQSVWNAIKANPQSAIDIYKQQFQNQNQLQNEQALRMSPSAPTAGKNPEAFQQEKDLENLKFQHELGTQQKFQVVTDFSGNQRLLNIHTGQVSELPTSQTATPNQVPGTTGSSTIDPSIEGYSSTPKAGGLTQSSIDQKAISYITAGTLPPQGRTGTSGAQNAAISNRMAELAPGGNLAVNKTQLKSFSQSLDQQQKYLDTTQRALNTANDTLDSLQTYMQKNNINPNQFPDYNRFSNFLKARGLDPGAAGGYNAQLATLRAEYSQVLAKGGVRSVETDREAAKLIPDGLNPADLGKVADQIKIDGMNVVKDAQKQVAQVTTQLSGTMRGAQPAAGQAPVAQGGKIPFANASGGGNKTIRFEDLP